MSDNSDATTGSDQAQAAVRAQASHLQEHLAELESSMEGMLRDHDTLQEDLDQTRTMIESVRFDMQLAQRAVARIDNGTYGQCVECGKTIAPARLEALPAVERCSNCA